MTATRDAGTKPGQTTLPCGRDAPPCCVTKLLVSCGHSERGYILQVPNQPTRNGVCLLQMVASDTVTIDGGPQRAALKTLRVRDLARIHLIGGPCRQGHPSGKGPGANTLVRDKIPAKNLRPVVRVSGPDIDVTLPSPYAVSVYGPEATFGMDDIAMVRAGAPLAGLALDLLDFIRKFLMPAEPYVYTAYVDACAAPKMAAVIEVFPKQSWEGAFAVSFEQKREKTVLLDPYSRSNAKAAKGKAAGALAPYKWNEKAVETRQMGMAIAVALTAKYGNQSVTVRPFLRTKEFPAKKLVTFVGKFKELVAVGAKPNPRTRTRGSWTINLPTVQVSGKLENVEKKGQWYVGWEGAIALNFQPLIGASMEADLLEWFLKTFEHTPHPVAKAIIKVALWAKERARQAEVLDVALVLKGAGSIEGGLAWKINSDAHDPNRPRWQPDEGSVGGKFELSLEGLVEAKSDFWNVAAGGRLGGLTGISGKVTHDMNKKGGDSIEWQVGWDGLTIFYSTYVRKMAGSESGPAPTSKPQHKVGTDDKERVGETGKTFTVFEPYYYPPKPPALSATQKPDKTTMSEFVA